MSFNKEKFLALVSSENSISVELAKIRKENRYWTRCTQRIAILILSTMKSKSITKKVLVSRSGIDLGTLNLILSGNYDLTISQIIRLEQALTVELIELKHWKK